MQICVVLCICVCGVKGQRKSQWLCGVWLRMSACFRWQQISSFGLNSFLPLTSSNPCPVLIFKGLDLWCTVDVRLRRMAVSLCHLCLQCSHSVIPRLHCCLSLCLLLFSAHLCLFFNLSIHTFLALCSFVDGKKKFSDNSSFNMLNSLACYSSTSLGKFISTRRWMFGFKGVKPIYI